MDRKTKIKSGRQILLLSLILAGIFIGLAAYSTLAGSEPQPQPGAGGACRGAACPTATPSDSNSDDQKIEAAWNAAATRCPKNESGTMLYKCVEFAKLFVKELAKRGLTEKIVTLQAGQSDMVSSRWKDKREAIAFSQGFHVGVEVNGKVYDNLTFDGLALEEWRLTFETQIEAGRYGPPSIVSNRK